MSERFTARGEGKAYFIGWGYNIKDNIEQRDYRQDEWLDALAEKMQEYEDAEEQGRLIKLPCAVGDTVWVIYDGYTTTASVLAFYIDREGGMCDLKINTNEDSVTGGNNVISKDYTFSDLFLTREETEAALKGADE